MNELEPVFGFMKNEPGTTLVHSARTINKHDSKTTCGIDCSDGWYGDSDLTLDDVECKRCRKAKFHADTLKGDCPDCEGTGKQTTENGTYQYDCLSCNGKGQ